MKMIEAIKAYLGSQKDRFEDHEKNSTNLIRCLFQTATLGLR